MAPNRRTERFAATFFAAIVKWITFARAFPGQSVVHRMARADFNVRGWQGRWRHTAPTALFFVPPETPAPGSVKASILAGR
jgi:hypothetical protein